MLLASRDRVCAEGVVQRQSQRPERQPFVGSERQPGDERQAESADQDQEYLDALALEKALGMPVKVAWKPLLAAALGAALSAGTSD